MQLDFLQTDPKPAVRAFLSAPGKRKTLPPAITIRSSAPDAPEKAPGAFKTISEAAAALDVPQHVLRFWESKFSQIKPLKLRGGRRYYRPEDMVILSTVKHLLYQQGYTIKGARSAFNGNGQLKEPLVAEVPLQVAVDAPSADRHDQLAALREELLTLRDWLAPYVVGTVDA